MIPILQRKARKEWKNGRVHPTGMQAGFFVIAATISWPHCGPCGVMLRSSQPRAGTSSGAPSGTPPRMLDNYFKLTESGTDVRTELLAGLTTFLTMAYIIFVNPSILGDAGMPKEAVFVATCLIAALGTMIMGLYANYPIATAPGMGLNAYFAYVVVLGMGLKWQVALGAVFISGCLFLLV